jgi:outer membrane protein assembly factor BamB
VVPFLEAKPAAPPDVDLGSEYLLPTKGVRDAGPVEPPPRPKKDRPAEPAVVDAVVVAPPQAEVVDAVVVGTPRVREVVWSPDADVPIPPGGVAAERDEPFFLPRRKKKKGNLPVYLLIGMASAVVILVGGGFLVWLQRTTGAEARLAAQAEEQYKAGDYGVAAKSYAQLKADFPDSDSRAKYDFYADLSALQRDVRSVTTRDEPGPAITKLLAFIDANKDSPFARSDGGAGGDVVGAGRKVAEDAAGHAEDRVKAFRSDRTKSDELRRAGEAIARGRELLQKLDPLRSPSDEPFDGLRMRFDRVAADIDAENTRSRGIAEIRALIARPTDTSVEAARAKLAEYNLTGDQEAANLVADANARLGRLVRYAPNPAHPVKPPTDYAGALAFVAPVGPTEVPERGPAPDQKPGVFLAVGRGLVYALDEETGNLLWVARVGAGVGEPPAVAAVVTADGPGGVAVVVSNVAGKPAVAGHDLRTGTLRWYQPLPAPPAGPAVVVGSRAYAPLRDADGTLIEIDVTTGERIGVITLGQPIGPPPVVRPGTGLIYVVAEARRVYVLDAGGRDVEGNRTPPRCGQVLMTGHTPGSVRSAPLILGPSGDGAAERWLVMAQVATPTESRLRVYGLPPLSPPSADGLAPPGVAVGQAVSTTVPGWTWLTPATDGERLGLVTDAGEFHLFGVNQPGNRDPALFPIPQGWTPNRAESGPAPGMVIPSVDGAFWVLAGGDEVQLVRVGLDPTKGLMANVVPRTVPPGQPALGGVPTQAAAINVRGDTAYLVVRPANSTSLRAVAFDLARGEVRWQRQLGLDFGAATGSATGPALVSGDTGGVVHIPGDGPGLDPGSLRPADSNRLACVPLDGSTGRTLVASSTDGSASYVLTPTRRRGEDVLAVRKVVGARAEKDGRVRLASPLAGQPVVLGETVAFPAADGFVYRVVWAEPPAKDNENFDRATLVRGPQWRPIEARSPGGGCHLTPLGGDRLAITDGDRTAAVWTWPAGGVEQPTGVNFALPQPIATTPVYLPGGDGQGRLLLADATGGIWLFPAERGGEPVRRWRPDGARVPAGRPTSAISVQSSPVGTTVVAYVVDGRHLLMLNPDVDGWTWVVPSEDRAERVVVGSPQPAGGGTWLVTELGGRVVLYAPLVKQRTVIGEVALPGVVPSAAGVMSGPSRVVVPLSDGSAGLIEIPPK